MAATKSKTILKKKVSYKVTGTLWIECAGERFFGPGRAELLQKIDETGSINKAAGLMKMSYKKAWDLVNDMNAQFTGPLVISSRGGKGGGNAVVTPKGLQVIQKYQKLAAHFRQFLKTTPLDFQL